MTSPDAGDQYSSLSSQKFTPPTEPWNITNRRTTPRGPFSQFMQLFCSCWRMSNHQTNQQDQESAQTQAEPTNQLPDRNTTTDSTQVTSNTVTTKDVTSLMSNPNSPSNHGTKEESNENTQLKKKRKQNGNVETEALDKRACNEETMGKRPGGL